MINTRESRIPEVIVLKAVGHKLMHTCCRPYVDGPVVGVISDTATNLWPSVTILPRPARSYLCRSVATTAEGTDQQAVQVTLALPSYRQRNTRGGRGCPYRLIPPTDGSRRVCRPETATCTAVSSSRDLPNVT